MISNVPPRGGAEYHKTKCVWRDLYRMVEISLRKIDQGITFWRTESDLFFNFPTKPSTTFWIGRMADNQPIVSSSPTYRRS